MFQKLIQNKQIPFWIFAFSLLIGLTLPVLIQDGMFMDAMLYTSVAHNLSMGIGTFWFPQFSLYNLAGLSAFHEQPPLVFGIQALFFKVFGSSLYVERFYTFLTLCISAWLIVLLWKEIFKTQTELKKLAWLPLIFWIIIPVCFWSYSNNMHENTMGIFTLSAVLFVYKSFRTEKFQLIFLMLGGIFIFCASLSKGVPGFFPMTVPVLYYLTTKKISFKKTLLATVLITLVPVVIYGVLLLFPESRESLTTYFFKRLLFRIDNDPTVDSRFFILGRLLSELIPSFILMLVFLFVAKNKRIKNQFQSRNREIIFFIAVGLSASVPLMFTMVQRGFYAVPCYPFFAIAFAMMIANVVSALTEKIKSHKISLVISSVLFIGVLIFSFAQAGKASRNQEMIHDLSLIGTIVPKHAIVGTPDPEQWNDWDLQTELMRRFNISLVTGYENKFCIAEKSLPADIPPDYKKINLETLRYDLYVKEK